MITHKTVSGTDGPKSMPNMFVFDILSRKTSDESRGSEQEKDLEEGGLVHLPRDTSSDSEKHS